MSSIFGSRIVSTGLGAPSKVVTNEDMAKIVDTSDEWIRTRTGIKERRFLDREGGEQISDVCERAGKEALEKAGWSPEEVDLLICCSMSAETLMPNNSARMIGRLGLSKAAGFDMSSACSGFVVGMHTADALIRSGNHKKVLVFGGEAMSGVLDMSDRKTCVLFGDGAGAVCLEAVENPDYKKDSLILGSKIYTDFDEEEFLSLPGGGVRYPPSDPRNLNEKKGFVHMNGQEVFKKGTRGMALAAQKVLEKCSVHPDQIKWFVPHQANLRIIEMVAKLLNFPMERVYVNVDRWGNTSAGTVPIALAEMNQKGLIQKGDLVLMDVFGGGFSYGAALARW